VENLDIDVAEKILEDLDLKVKVSGEGNIVSRQQAIKKDNQIVGVSLFLKEETNPNRKLMPSLTGMSLKEALSTLDDINLSAVVDGHGIVISQHPKPGSKIDTRKPVKLVCKPT
jgi:beta-lactam-binding protein with PASTA domain